MYKRQDSLSPEQKRYLLGKQYEAEKKAAKIFRGNQYTLAKKSGGDHGDNHHSGKKTCDRIAEENGVSRASVLRASHYTRGIDIADNLSPGIKQKVFSGEVKDVYKRQPPAPAAGLSGSYPAYGTAAARTG